MVNVLGLSILALAGLYLIALGAVSLASPRLARAFLSAFAGSPAKHFIELAIRLTVGAACIAAAPWLPWPRPFEVLGWLLVATTAALLFVPWRAHQRFAQISVSRATDYPALLGIASVLAGLAVLASVWNAAPLDQ